MFIVWLVLCFFLVFLLFGDLVTFVFVGRKNEDVKRMLQIAWGKTCRRGFHMAS